MGWRSSLIVAGFNVFGATGLHRLAAPMTRGLGAILTFHHVRPQRTDAFAPNRLLETTPDFLDRAIRHLRQRGYDIVTMDDAVRIIADGRSGGRPFAVLTFDDGFRDHLEWALPVLERNRAPGVFYIASGFPDRTARLWWVELEVALRKAERVTVVIDDETLDLPTLTVQQKYAAFAAIYWRLRRGPEERLLAVIAGLCAAHAVDRTALVETICLDWPEVATLARHPLVTIGAHTMSHAMLAKHGDERVRQELAGGRRELEERLGQPVEHFAFPVGDHTSAASRDFKIAAEVGYTTAVTTRPGLIFPAHRTRLTSLPRVSVNGEYQTLRDLDVLLSGAAFTLWNKGRRVPPV